MQVDIKILIYVIVIYSRSILAFNYLRGLLPLNFQKWLICIKLPYWQYPYIIPQTGNENAQTYPVKVVTWFKFLWLIYKEMYDSQRGEFKTRSWELKGLLALVGSESILLWWYGFQICLKLIAKPWLFSRYWMLSCCCASNIRCQSCTVFQNWVLISDKFAIDSWAPLAVSVIQSFIPWTALRTRSLFSQCNGALQVFTN